MKKQFMLVGALVSVVGLAFGYGDDDLDPSDHAYSDTTYYVQCQGYSGGYNNDTSYFYDNGGAWYKGGTYSFPTNTDFWSTGVGPDKNPTLDYYINKDHQLFVEPKYSYIASHQNTFPGHSLTVGAGASFYVGGNAASLTYYQFKIANFYLRPNSRIYSWNANPFCFGEGTMTILAEDEASPAGIFTYKTGQGYYFMNDLVGSENARLHLQGVYELSKYAWGAAIGFMNFTGDNSEYRGLINVGCDLTVRLGNGGFPNASVQVTGTAMQYYKIGKVVDTNTTYTTIGVCATDGNKPEIGELSLADGVTMECTGMVTNNNGFYVYGYKQRGLVLLDFGNQSVVKKLCLLQVANGSDSTALNTDSFTITNLANEADCALSVESDPESQDQMLVIGPKVTYVTLTNKEANVWSPSPDAATFAYFGASFWSDGLAPHAGADYMLSGDRSMYMPINYQLAGVSAGRKSGYGDFYGDSLTLVDGGLFRYGTAAYSTALYYPMYFKDLRLGSGGCIRQYGGKLSAIFDARGKISIVAKADAPGYFLSGSLSSGAANLSRVFVYSALAGEGTAILSGGATYEKLDETPLHWMEFNGNNEAFTGTLRVGFLTKEQSQIGYPTRPNLDLHFGASGLPNGSLVMESFEPRLGVSTSATGLMVPIKNLTLVGGNTLGVDTMMTNNNMRGFLVTGSYQQTGIVTVDVANVALSARAINVLRIPTSIGSLDAANFVLVNDPDENAQLKVTTLNGYQTLQIVDEAAKTEVVLEDSVRCKLVTVVEAGETINLNDYKVTGSDPDTDWYRFYTVGDSLYVENLTCLDETLYDVRLRQSDYLYTNEVTHLPCQSFLEGQNWSDKLAPHAGADYVSLTCLVMLTNPDAQTFGGDSFTLCGKLYTSGYSRSWLRDDNNNVDMTINDFRMLDGSIVQSTGGTNFCLRGTLRVLSTEEHAAVFSFSHPYADMHLAATLLGGESRVLGAAITGQSNYGPCVRSFWLDGDASEYKGTLVMTNTYLLVVGPNGLGQGTADIISEMAGVTSSDATKAVEVGTLKLADGAWIQAKMSAQGLKVNKLLLAGTVKLDFGKTPLASDITVLTVPSTETLSVSSFTVPTPLAGYYLTIVEGADTKSLVYTNTKPVSNPGAVILLK